LGERTDIICLKKITGVCTTPRVSLPNSEIKERTGDVSGDELVKGSVIPLQIREGSTNIIGTIVRLKCG